MQDFIMEVLSMALALALIVGMVWFTRRFWNGMNSNSSCSGCPGCVTESDSICKECRCTGERTDENKPVDDSSYPIIKT